MTAEQQAIFEGIYEAQKPHPVEPMFSLAELIALGEGDAYAAVRLRAEKIVQMSEWPLDCAWAPEELWLYLLLLTEKRIEFPGAVLEFFMPGGVRGGKSFQWARLMVAHWKFTRRAMLFCLSGSQQTSQVLQQQPMEYFLPEEALGAKGSIKQTRNEKAKFSGGKFTDNKFTRYLTVTDERGETYQGGGTVEWRFFTQDKELFKGYAISSVWWDEQCPITLIEEMVLRCASRAVETRELWHKEKMLVLRRHLQDMVDGKTTKPPPMSLIGALMHGVIGGSYTPEEGYVPTVRRYMQGAEKPEKYLRICPELVGKAGVKDPRAPIVVLPANPKHLVGYLWTSMNRMVDSYSELKQAAENWDERTTRIRLCGDVEAAEDVLFGAFGDRHLFDWKDVPGEGRIFVVVDPAPAKPWSIGIYLIDAMGRAWLLMEWPCPGVALRIGEQWIDPGAWAVPTSGNNLNGDKGPAQKLRLGMTETDHTILIYQMLRACWLKMKDAGVKWTGATETDTLHWRSIEVEGPRLVAELVIGDKRYLGNSMKRGDEVVRVLYALLEEEHALPWDSHKGDAQREGIILIQSALNRGIGGMPGLLVNRECRDAIFSLRTYSLPDGKDAPPEADQACKESIDRWRYLFMYPSVVDAEGECSTNEDGGR